jgi:2-(1,2-epoxy-1,2-dihydrophenyl)acetyl-CoA isomerase
MTEPGLLVDRSEDVVTITLNQPAKKNAISEEMWIGLLDNFRDLRRDTSVRVVVITGAGDGFCSGADVSAFVRSDDDERPAHPLYSMRRTKDIALALHELPMPTIAKVNGVAAGAGCNLALGCDLIIASDRARFSEIFSKRALSLDFGGAWILPRLIGLHKAKELAFFGDILNADDAHAMGLVNRVVPHDELDVTVDEWAKRLAAGPPLALTQSKSMLNKSMGLSMEEALDVEAAAQAINLSTKDNREAGVAFFEKRDAVFEGR